MRLARLAIAAGSCAGLASGAGCGGTTTVSNDQRLAIADSLVHLIKSAYNLSKPDVPASLMSLYPTKGRIVSASGGNISTTRDSLEAGVRAFWTYVGTNMRDPQWTWGKFFVDVVSPNAAVVTFSYRVPHKTPAGEAHVIGGAWTAVFERRDGAWVIIQEHLSDVPQAVLAAEAATPAPMQHDMHGRAKP